MMFRRFFIRLGRVAVSLGILWFILAVLWFLLPSPVPADRYPSSALNGKTLTRVFKIEEFYPYTDSSQPVKDARATGRWYMSLDFVLLQNQETRQRSLAIGGGNDPFAKFFNNGKLLPHHNVSLLFDTKDIHVSQPIQLSARTGDLDGVNPPWLATADSALLFWWIHRDHAITAVRARFVPADKRVEIWPDAGHWYQNNRNDPPTGLSPLLVVRLPEDEEPILEFPSLPKSSSPSPLYVVRIGILTLLAPISILFLSAFYLTTGALSGLLYVMIEIVSLFAKIVGLAIGCVVLYGFVWWFRNGRPSIPFTEIGRAVSTVINSARNRPAEPAVEETGLIDLEAGVRQPEAPMAEPGVLVDVSLPKVSSIPEPTAVEPPSST